MSVRFIQDAVYVDWDSAHCVLDQSPDGPYSESEQDSWAAGLVSLICGVLDAVTDNPHQNY